MMLQKLSFLYNIRTLYVNEFGKTYELIPCSPFREIPAKSAHRFPDKDCQ